MFLALPHPALQQRKTVLGLLQDGATGCDLVAVHDHEAGCLLDFTGKVKRHRAGRFQQYFGHVVPVHLGLAHDRTEFGGVQHAEHADEFHGNAHGAELELVAPSADHGGTPHPEEAGAKARTGARRRLIRPAHQFAGLDVDLLGQRVTADLAGDGALRNGGIKGLD